MEIDTKAIRQRYPTPEDRITTLSLTTPKDDIFALCDALDACRKREEEALKREAVALLALEMLADFHSEHCTKCPKGVPRGCDMEDCEVCIRAHFLQQAAAKIEAEAAEAKPEPAPDYIALTKDNLRKTQENINAAIERLKAEPAPEEGLVICPDANSIPDCCIHGVPHPRNEECALSLCAGPCVPAEGGGL